MKESNHMYAIAKANKKVWLATKCASDMPLIRPKMDPLITG
jgi:hypothetical protein